jgi:hypothetical protein
MVVVTGLSSSYTGFSVLRIVQSRPLRVELFCLSSPVFDSGSSEQAMNAADVDRVFSPAFPLRRGKYWLGKYFVQKTL